jgi:hypothetical protein
MKERLNIALFALLVCKEPKKYTDIFFVNRQISITVINRVSSETSFDSKQPKLEPKLFSTLFETRCLFRLFRFYIETARFGVSIKPKQKKMNRNKPKKDKNWVLKNLFSSENSKKLKKYINWLC